MSKIEFETNGVNFEFSVWNPTFQLRWCKRTIETEITNIGRIDNVLQQLWISNIGSEEWRDISQVEN
jgi:hypothetical protein